MKKHLSMNHYRFRAETIVDVINLRLALYEFEKTSKRLFNFSFSNTFNSSFKFAILLPYSIPDIEVLLSSPYSLKDIKTVMKTVIDSHVMIETLTMFEDYSGDRSHDSEDVMDLDVIKNIWSTLANTDDFYFRGISLNATNLYEKALPYVLSLIELQKIINEISGKNFQQPQIRSIESGSVTFSFFPGLGDAIKAIDEFFRLRKRRAEAEKLEYQAKLEQVTVEKTKLEIRQQEIGLELLQKQAEIENDPKIIQSEKQERLRNSELEYMERLENLRKKRIENDRDELQLLKEYKDMAEDFLSPFIPEDMPIAERFNYIMKAIKPLQTIETSQLELHRGRPDSLPEFPLNAKYEDE